MFKRSFLFVTVMVCRWLHPDISVTGIDTGNIDPNCQVDCACCKNQKCGPRGYFPEGNCYEGCIDGYRGGRCIRKCTYNECAECSKNASICTRCKDGYYPGSNNDCSLKCPVGCETCISSTMCTQCKKEYFNANGSTDCRYQNCPNNCICENKKCLSCMDGYFNVNTSCNSECPANCITCSSTDNCETCEDGYYNGHGYDNINISVFNNCSNKCRENCAKCSSYNHCLQCEAGRYGLYCEKNCSLGCVDGICERHTGNCNCSTFFSGDQCCVEGNNCKHCASNHECKECTSGYFGTLCNENCSSTCLGPCDLQTGKCYNCEKSFFGFFCNIPCPENCTESKNISESLCDETDGRCHFGCMDGTYASRCNESCSKYCIDDLCEQDSGKCTRGCEGEYSDPACPFRSAERKSLGIFWPAVGSSLVLIVLVVIIVMAIFCHRNRTSTLYSEPTTNMEAAGTGLGAYENISDARLLVEDEATMGTGNDSPADVNVNAYGNMATDVKHVGVEIRVAKLLSFVTAVHTDCLDNEFRKLPKAGDFSTMCRFALLPENKAFNRYNGIYPYDHSRVTIPEKPKFFINACYIDGYNRRHAYIASVGPTKKTTNTFVSFWTMVWHEKVDIIVMLTNLDEITGMKCEQYWPKEERGEKYGSVKVECRSVEVFAEYTVRTFVVSKGKEERNLTQLHYTAWPDKGVPSEVTSLVEFRQRVKTAPVVLNGPVLVHCSAGIGRTGTYLALDILTEEGMSKRSVNVFQCVSRLRNQRVKMVQTAEQYKFLYKALVHSLTFKCESQTAEMIQRVALASDDTFTDMLQTLKREVDLKPKEELEAQEENKRKFADKSRRCSDIPGKRGRVCLHLQRKSGDHDYINAVFVDSFKIKNLFITAQTPLTSTVEDFVCMIFQQDATCVVALEDPRKPVKKNDMGKYLPAAYESYICGNYTVRSTKLDTKPQYILKKLAIQQTEGGEEKFVYHFHYTKWGIGQKVADSATDFVQFVKDIQRRVNGHNTDAPNIVVHCLNGYERSGLFCVVYTLLEKLEAERQVSVVNAIRKVRAQRKSSVSSVEQLKFCYQCMSAYLDTFNVYSNYAT